MSTTPLTASRRSLALLSEIRERLQSAHFAARDMSIFEHASAREPVADQLHAIRLLAEELEARLAA